jgi:hypothetical protein
VVGILHGSIRGGSWFRCTNSIILNVRCSLETDDETLLLELFRFVDFTIWIWSMLEKLCYMKIIYHLIFLPHANTCSSMISWCNTLIREPHAIHNVVYILLSNLLHISRSLVFKVMRNHTQAFKERFSSSLAIFPVSKNS